MIENVKVIEMPLHQDERGWVVWPLREPDVEAYCISNLHVPSLQPGAVRGNHYHLNSTEFALVLSGPCLVIFVHNESGEKEEILVEGSKPVLFKIPPNITHAFRNQSEKEIFLLCYEKRASQVNSQATFRKEIL